MVRFRDYSLAPNHQKSSGKIVALVQNEMFQPVIIGLETQRSILSMRGQQVTVELVGRFLSAKPTPSVNTWC